MSSEPAGRVYAITVGPDLRYLVVEPVARGWVLRTFEIAGSELAAAEHVYPSRADAQLAATTAYGERLQGWWVVPDEVRDAAYYARCHKDAPAEERRRLLA